MADGDLADLDTLVAEAMAEWQVPGLALAILRPDAPPLLKAYGQRDVESALPLTVDTQFLICSITKSFTAVGLGMLVDERRLDWTKPVREYIPEFRLHDPVATDRVTVQDLLCHHSGLPRHDWVWMTGDRSPHEVLAALRYLQPSKDIRTLHQYSNLGYMVAGLVAERITGQSWVDFTRARILAPLGMSNVGFSVADLAAAPDQARPYVMVDDEPGVFVRRRAALWPIRNTAAGGITASIAEMAKYAGFLLADGVHDGVRLLSSATLRALATPRVHAGRSEFAEIGDHHYGFGLSLHHYRGERVVGHGGSWIGWSTLLAMMPERRHGVVVLTNRAPSGVTDIVTMAALDRLCGRDVLPWLERFRTRRRQGVEQRKADHAARRAARKPNTPSRDLAEYTGRYEHPAYGRITIAADGDALRWQFHGLSGVLAHRHYDVFEVPENLSGLSPDRLAVTFGYDREGNIDRLSAPFEPQVPDIVFTRAAAGAVLDAAFVQRCIGTYRHGATMHVVAIDANGHLTLSPTGQPTFRLVPYHRHSFAIAELDGYRVEFQPDDAGAVNTIVFHQPNGTFYGQRVAG